VDLNHSHHLLNLLHLLLVWNLLQQLSHQHSLPYRDVALLQEHQLLQLLEKLGLELQQRAYVSWELLPPRVPVRQQKHLYFHCLLLTYFF
jgi:hypothetical protein